jgi:hypothetical protein
VNPGITIIGLDLSYKTEGEFDIDLTFHNDSRSAQSVMLPPDVSIENYPRALTASHPSEFEMMPSQESTYTWSAQVDHRAVTVVSRVIADVVSGKKTITLRTHFKDPLGHWYTSRVIGRFLAGKFLTLEALPAEPSPAPT